ncbi:MAG: aminotransferase class III-fold pyridoxal phosphate-dependent enzyme [Deltaproteobacteria bacterium]|nr:aminotransferase class III-fold pyridoxal phosphate-dependent enzyme [Deltaproteobacteria bacterium]
MALRRRYLNPSLSVSYRDPLKIVRGEGAYLFDSSGRAFLDLVNNVCHVGHCHPAVVAAGQEQMAVLNTNSRYLHDHIVEYARRLTATLPDPLEVCFFVNSGSEANDLALRLARNFTGRQDIVAVAGAYHGNLSSLIDISSYKFDGPGGRGKPQQTHIVPVPDGYRGPHRGSGEEVGGLYGDTVVQAIAAADARGTPIAAFIHESIISCGGQVVLPPGYLQQTYGATREAGGICIADEVQVGFGRCGSHFWAFETQGVVPDIVTMGKPMGNGHPLAAVVTHRAVAEAFANGMEYFNTFGGNPVSCSIGLAVLDAVEGEGLQQRALELGGAFLEGLKELASRHSLIGDVRGLGLFLGIELVRDQQTLEPAAEEAAAIVEAMRQRGFLLSTDGPLHNVIKIKPPMVLTRRDIESVLSTLDAVFSDPPGGGSA